MILTTLIVPSEMYRIINHVIMKLLHTAASPDTAGATSQQALYKHAARHCLTQELLL